MKQLTLIDKAFLLKRTPLFSALDLDLLLTIADKLGTVVFEPNDSAFFANEQANRMYFIVQGQVEIRDPHSNKICTLTAGDFFGEESLFSNKPRTYSAFIPAETHLLTLSRSNLYSIISECPSVAIGFLQVYAANMQFRPLKVENNS
jgi:CRP/FNR family transcriptional regulator, cyclic AMP receptor protein